MWFNYMNRRGFTLAELLIAMGIIGIVATYTIPALFSNYQNAQYITHLKKAYNVFNQALRQMAVDRDCVNDLKCTNLFAAGTTNVTFGDELVKYFKVIKNCGIQTNKGCWPTNVNNYYDGSSYNIQQDSSNAYYKFITADGMSFLVKNYADASGGLASDCNNNYGSSMNLGYMSQTCGYVWVDVNGFKGPNYYGRDVFTFFITNGKGALLYPHGGMDDKAWGTDYWWNIGGLNKCSASGNKTGDFCAGRILEKNWNMDY